jgi:DNA-binding MarR family transcriptional regulator
VREALDSVRRLVRALRLGANRAHESAGISSAELFILRALEENGPANSLNELAARTYTDQSSASPVVTRLQRRHLIRRQRSEHDRRRISIELTDRGRQVLSRAPDAPQSGIIAALRRLPPADRTQIARALTKLVEQMGLDDERATMLFEEPSKR